MKRALTLIPLVLLFSCIEPDPIPDPVIPSAEECEAACKNLKRLGCPEGNDFTDGEGRVVTCEAFCVNTQNKGHDLNPSCVAKVSSCEAVDSCSER